MSDLAEAIGRLVRAELAALPEEAVQRLAERMGPYLEATGTTGDEWLDSAAAARHLGLSRAALYKLTAARAVPFQQDGPGCRVWFRRDELDRWRRGEGSRSEPRALGTSRPSRMCAVNDRQETR